ncbi:MAG: vitamin B12 dependent methionine synthase [Anaerotardibacter sp.]
MNSAPYLYERKNTTISLDVDLDCALRFMGYTGQELTADLVARLQQMAQKCSAVAKPSYVWRLFDIESITPQAVVLKGQPLVLEGSSITHHLEGATQVVLLGATLGLVHERESQALASINSLDALLFNACSNALIEQVADFVQNDINEWAKKNGLFAKMRFSPGYGDLPLDIQPQFLKVLGAQKSIGLHVLPTNILVPMKSITAIVGLFNYETDTSFIPCTQCAAFEFCSYREKGIICHG